MVWAALCAALVAAPAAAQRTPLHDAALKGDLAKVKVLLKRSPKALTSRQGAGVLCMAAFSGNQQLVRYLLGKGAKVTDRDVDGSTPLHHAADGGHKALVELLLAKGARVKALRKDGWTPLHAAAAAGHLPVAEVLVAKGADLNAPGGRRGDTPLATARRYGHEALAEYLRDRGAKERIERAPVRNR